MSKKHILILGATGLCGQLLVKEALNQGHELTLYVRNPSKLAKEILSTDHVKVIEGEFDNLDGLKIAANCGAEVFICVAGPTLGEKNGKPITLALHRLYEFLLQAGTFKRILTLSTPSYSAPEDKFSLKWYIIINGYIRLFGGDAYEEIRGIAQETVALGEKRSWTVFRVPMLHGETLNSSEEDLVNACFVGDAKGRDVICLDRGRLVKWIIKELEEAKWINLCPLLSNAK